jgi:hypothetical protein
MMGASGSHRRTGGNMAKGKKRGPVRRGKSSVRGKVRKTAKARGKTAKRIAARAKPKRAAAKKKKVHAMKPGSPSVETVVVDVIEQPAPDVITVTEFEETEVTRPGGNETEA